MKIFAVLLFAVALLGAGCRTTPRKTLPLTGDPLVDGPLHIQQGAPRDKVLWEYRTALASLHRGQFEEAASYLDAALDRIEGVIGRDDEARKARGYFSPEARKTFLGEPYERVMAYYYRGLLFWMIGDLGNARACFRSAQVMDAAAAEETYASDYALLDYFEGLTTVKLGGNGDSAWQRAKTEARLAPVPPYAPQANVLFFVDYGAGPIKYATGQYAQELRFRPGSSSVRSARVRVASTNLPAPPYDDIYFQATTRGGRVMDHILANKAVFKSSTDVAGTAAIISGVVVAGDRRHQEVGLGLIAAGILAKALAGATTPEADVRTWENLPAYLSFATTQLPPGRYSAAVEFLDEGGRLLANLSKTVEFDVLADGRDTVIFVSDKSVTPQNL